MILSCNLKKNNIPRLIHHNWEFRVASDNDTDQLVGISEDLYVHSRYYFDLNFPREKVKTFYQDWVSKAIRGEFDDLAYVLCIDGCPQAFCTLRFNGNESMIGLVGVHSKYSGKGLGKAVLENSLMKLKDIGINKVSVITQGRNYPAQRLYQRVGFLIEKSQVYYHLWI
jgi:GNAT superfamily N-acetyltransferase